VSHLLQGYDPPMEADDRILGRFGTWHWAKAKTLQPEEALQRVRLYRWS